jgi:hypothetical protein
VVDQHQPRARRERAFDRLDESARRIDGHRHLNFPQHHARLIAESANRLPHRVIDVVDHDDLVARLPPHGSKHRVDALGRVRDETQSPPFRADEACDILRCGAKQGPKPSRQHLDRPRLDLAPESILERQDLNRGRPKASVVQEGVGAVEGEERRQINPRPCERIDWRRLAVGIGAIQIWGCD